MEYRDYYATLEVPRTASQADIKKAYRKLARRYHPDVAKSDPAAERRFKDVNEAHAVLGDPKKRRLYDQLGANWEAYARAGAGGTGGGAAAGGFTGFPGGIRFEYHGDPEDLAGFSDFFRAFFAGNPVGFETAASDSRVRTGRATTLDELLGGMGLGGLDPDDAAPGSARATVRRPAARSVGDRASTRRAAGYEATAEITLEEAFHGSTRIVELDGRRLEVRIPRGIDTGRRIRMAGAGQERADVHILVRVRPHPVFVRKGNDLHRELPLTLVEALLGAEVPVGTLKGRVLLKVPPGTQPGRTFRLAGQGMPHLAGGGVGDLYVKVRVVLPDSLDEEAKALARRLAARVKQPDPRRA
jgi:curved DNA-binding protein